MDATRLEPVFTDSPDAADAPTRGGLRWRRLAPAVVFLAGAATVGLVGFGGDERLQRRDEPEESAIELAAAGEPVVVARQAATVDSHLSAATDEAAGGYTYVEMEVTAYCPCQICCGKRARGITASGRHVDYNGGLFVAADTTLLPFYTRLQVPGYGGEEGAIVEVLDRGGLIKGHKLDVFFPDHRAAQQWGVQQLPVKVYSPDGRRSSGR